METITAPTINEPSLADIRAILGGEKPAEPTPEPNTETSEQPAAEAAPEPTTEAASEPAEQKPEPEEPKDDLPEGVKKRIAKEVEKAARIQSEIDRAVSARKAKEQELAKVSQEGRGSDPVTKTEPSKPQRPVLGEPGHEQETWQQFQEREAAYEDARESWLRAEAIREFEERTATREAQRTAQERWGIAIKKHGDEFPGLIERARQAAPEGLQQAISALDAWDDVAVHLARHPAQLQELAAAYQQNQVKAIATLGRIEAAIAAKPEPKPATEPLPKPLAKVGGAASANQASLQDTIEKGSWSQLRAAVERVKR